MQEANKQIKKSREKVLAWTTAMAGPSGMQEGTSQVNEGSNYDNEEIGPDDEDNDVPESFGWSRYAYCKYSNEELPHEGGPCDCLHYLYDD